MRSAIESPADLVNLTDNQIKILLRSSNATESEREIMQSELAARVPFEFTGLCGKCGQLVADGRSVHRSCERA